jgi:effector-binding domain-containing protein
MERVEMTDPELVDVNETTTVVIHGVVPMTEIADFFDRSFSELASVLDRQGIAATGSAFARYAGQPGETADIEVGFPVHESVTAEGQVHPSSLPAGPAARLLHAGGYDQLGEAWGRLGAWMPGPRSWLNGPAASVSPDSVSDLPSVEVTDEALGDVASQLASAGSGPSSPLHGRTGRPTSSAGVA